jgi:endonuclease/exonuclease/phosphatase family metal-dependent hydrolase
MNLITWNLLHSTGATLDNVISLINAHQPDLLLMQEATAMMDALPARIGGHYSRAVLPGRHHGLAAWSPAPFRTKTLPLQRGVIVRRICQILEFDNLAIANVHLSHGQLLNRVQLRQIAKILPPCAAILGDCNMVGHPLLPGFSDAGPRLPTHNAARRLPLRLDRCFIRNVIARDAAILPAGASDHHPLKITLMPANLT